MNYNNFFKNGSKSQMLYQEAIIIVFSLLIISLTLYFVLNNISGVKLAIEKSPKEITYKFPAVFVHTFLYTKVPNEDIANLNLDTNKDYYLKDILYLNTNDSKEIVSKLREDYLVNIKKKSFESSTNYDLHTYYKEFSKSNYNENRLLFILTDLSQLPILEDSFEEKNYFYFIKTRDEKYTMVYFLKSESNQYLVDSELSNIENPSP